MSHAEKKGSNSWNDYLQNILFDSANVVCSIAKSVSIQTFKQLLKHYYLLEKNYGMG